MRQKAAEARRKLEEVIDFSKLSPATLAFDELREKVMAIVGDDAQVTPTVFAEQVLGDRQMFLRKEREKLAATNGKLSVEKINAILKSVRDARARDEAEYDKDAVAWLHNRLTTGQMRSVDDVDDWNRAILKAGDNKAIKMMVATISPRIGSKLRDDARSHIADLLAPHGDSGIRAWDNWAELLQLKLGWYSQAEESYRTALGLYPQSALLLNNLGSLLKLLGRFEEAESTYRNGIATGDPQVGAIWSNLGSLFGRLGRFEEAELAYRKGIEIGHPYIDAIWTNLGRLLAQRLGRFEEAEAAYRKAINLGLEYTTFAWTNLGNLLESYLGRPDEAGAAYRKAIELNPQSGFLWITLGSFLQNRMAQYEEAEIAYLKAIELNSENSGFWNSLGNLYCDHLHRYTDAASAYTKAAEIDESDESARHNLIFLLRDFKGDKESALREFGSLHTEHKSEANDSFHLQEALFAAYDSNWGLGREALSRAIEAIGYRFPVKTENDWFRASAVILHLDYGEELLGLLRERGDDAKLWPWYEALSALHRGDRRYLQNIPVEVRTTAEYYFDQIEKRLNALPEKTRRRPLQKLAAKTRKARN